MTNQSDIKKLVEQMASSMNSFDNIVGLNVKKELLDMWRPENEGAKFWLGVLTELQNRGIQDILIACVDGLKGFPDALNTVYLNAQVQLCIVKMVRYSMKFVPWTNKKAVAADLKASMS